MITKIETIEKDIYHESIENNDRLWKNIRHTFVIEGEINYIANDSQLIINGYGFHHHYYTVYIMDSNGKTIDKVSNFKTKLQLIDEHEEYWSLENQIKRDNKQKKQTK